MKERSLKILAVYRQTVGETMFLVGAVLASANANAQTIPGQESAIAEIVVTAERREERLQDVPVAVTAITASQLTERVFYDPSQIQYIAPSLQTNGVSSAPGIANYSIRGVGTGSFSNAIEYSVSTMLDGVVLGRPELGVVQYLDVDRIEVLRGPQGTLFGKNASAGVINIVTALPVLNTSVYKANIEAAHVSSENGGLEGRVEGVANVPLTSTSALRLAAFGNYHSPLVDNVHSGNDSDYAFREGGVKAKYLWQPTDRFRLYIMGDYAGENGVGSGAFTLRQVGAGPAYPPVLAASTAASGITPGAANTENAADGPYGAKFQVGGAQAQIDYDLGGDYMLTNISAWRFYRLNAAADSDLTDLNYFNQIALQLDDTQFSNETRLATPTGQRLEAQVGTYLYSGRFVRDSQVGALLGNNALPPGRNARGGSSDSVQHAKSAAAFGQMTFEVVPGFRLIAGGRLTYDDVSLDTDSTLGNNVVAFFPVGTLKQERTHTDFSYKGGMQWDLGKNSMAYFTYTRGYKGPAFNNTANSVAAVAVNPEIVKAYELGVKTTLFDRRLVLNAAAFTETFYDYQTTSLDPVLLQAVLQNAGNARSRGLELEFVAQPLSYFTVSGGVTYADATAEGFTDAPCWVGQTVAEGCRVVRPAAPGSPAVTATDASGQPMVNAPKYAANTTFRYKHQMSVQTDAFASLSGYYRTSSNFSNNGNPYTKIGGYGIIDGDLGLTAMDDRYRVALFVRNLTDRRFPAAIQANAAAPGAYQQSFTNNSFRTFGVSFTYRY
jgi:iron complex outermembrane receptor protein